MSLTRRELLMGTAIVAAGAPLAVVPDSQPQPAPILVDSRVPSSAELEQWELAYKIHYRTQHRARNQALDQLNSDGYPVDPQPMRADKVLLTLEAEQAAAFALVDEAEHDSIAFARGNGFAARRDGKPATANQYEEAKYRHSFMAWYAGWVQGDPDLKLPRTRGYTKPSGYVCPLCDAPEGRHHTGPKYDGRKFWELGGSQEVCEDHLIVTRTAARRPGQTFT